MVKEKTEVQSRRELPYEKRAREMIEFAKIGVPPPLDVKRTRGAAVTRNREAQETETHQVYFLYCAGRIKIGTSRDPLWRIMNAITPYCPAPHTIIGKIPGGPVLEARLHERFADSRDFSEWFHIDPELRQFLCEDAARAKGLNRAEEGFRDWLFAEFAALADRDADHEARPDESGGDRRLDSDAWSPGG